MNRYELPLSALIALSAATAAPAQTVSHELYGSATSDQLGHAVAGGSDFDNDGINDFIVGTPFANTGGKTNNGRVQVFSGADGTVLATLEGDNSDDRFGWSVAIVGDTDGDGWDEVVVGAPNALNGADRPGQAKMFAGNGFSQRANFYGASDGDEFGYSVAGGIDRDVDGFPDVIVGAPGYAGGGVERGRVYLYSSVSQLLIAAYSLNTDYARNGHAVACVGDVDGSGTLDFAIGAPGATSTGRVYVEKGETSFTLYSWGGDDAGDEFGSSVAGGLDVNNDGYFDVLVGAREDDDNGTACGSVRLMNGENGSIVHTWYGESASDRLGTSVALIEDLDGDGRADVVGGATEEMIGRRGSVRVFTTRPSKAEILRVEGDSQSHFGHSVAALGDVDGNGTPDIIAGGPLARDPNNVLTNFVGQAKVFNAACPGFITYCTAGISASGCVAQLSASGMPSATAPSGFTLTASFVEGNKNGIFYYGANGRQAAPWGSGSSYQCVVPPVRRGGILPGTGLEGKCNGTFSQDLNSRWCPSCPKSSQNFAAGTVVQAQLWYRDPMNTSNQTTSLSNAIEFAVCP